MALKCPYCFYFFYPVKRRKKGGKGERRFCGAERIWIDGDSEICSNFLLKDDFWCVKNNHWKKIAACLHQRETHSDCVACRQFDRDISLLIEMMLKESPSIRKSRLEDFKKYGFKKFSKKRRAIVNRDGEKKRKVVVRKKGKRKVIRRR